MSDLVQVKHIVGWLLGGGGGFIVVILDYNYYDLKFYPEKQ